MAMGATADGSITRRLALVGAITAGVAFAATVVVGMVEAFLVPYERLAPDSELSVFDWASTGAALIAAFVCAVHTVVASYRRWMFAVLAGVLAYMSLDDEFLVHETLGTSLSDRLGLEHIGATFWTAIYAPLVPLVGVALWRIVRTASSEARTLLVVGFTLFAAAFLFEVARGVLGHGNDLQIAVGEEALELAGWTLVASALTIVLVSTLIASPASTTSLVDRPRG